MEKDRVERKTYNAMKSRRISTLDLNAVLAKVGIDISQRTLQAHLDNEFGSTDDETPKKVALMMIENYDAMIINIKEKIWK